MNQKLITLAFLFLLLAAHTSAQGKGGDNGKQTNSPNDDSGQNNTDNDIEEEEEPQQPVDQTENQELESKKIEIGDKFSVNARFNSTKSYEPVGFFHFTIEKKLSKKDLTFMVRGREDFSHSPAMFYSYTNKLPGLSNDEDYISCGVSGHDFCVIPESEVHKGDTIYLGVFCLYSCKFEVMVLYDTLFNQMLNEQARYESYKNDPYILCVQITIPPDFNEPIEHILIESYIINFLTVESQFHMYVNKGSTPPTPTSYDYVTEVFRLNGQSILIEDNEFPPGQVYTVSIEVPPQAQILVNSEGFGLVRPIYYLKPSTDMVKKNQVRLFKLQISPYTSRQWNESEISFDLEPFFGNPDLYVIHNELPQDPLDLKSYTWKSIEEDGVQSLTISKNSINMTTLIGEVFYIAVLGQTSSSFKLLAYPSDLLGRQLEFDSTENGYVGQNDLIQYQFFPIGENDTNISIILRTFTGEGHLFLKNCLNQSEPCKILESDISNSTLTEPTFYRSEEPKKYHKMQFQFSPSKCIDANFVNICSWTVGVLGVASGQTQYKLLAKHSLSPTQLRENEEQKSYMKEGNKEYFVFLINQEDETIEKVEFIINSISGQFTVYSSRKYEKPNEWNMDQSRFASQDIIVYKKNENNKSFQGTYYIGVEASTACIYSIFVKVFRNDKGKISSNMKRIHYGNVEKGFISYLEPHQYYFTIPQEERNENHQSTIVLYFNAFKNTIQNNISLEPDIKVHFLSEGVESSVEFVQSPYTASDFIYWKVWTNSIAKGRYVVTINHSSTKHQDYQIKFELNVNAFDIIYIVPSSIYILDQNDREQDNYELYLEEPSQVYVEIFECFGKVKVQASNSIQGIESKNYDVKSRQPPRFIGDHTIVNYERKSSGPFYISVESFQGIKLKDENKSLYMIIPHIIPLHQVIPHDVYSTPLEGQISTDIDFIDYEQVKMSQVNVTFGVIECVNDCIGSIYKANRYRYLISITNKEQLLQAFSKCDMNPQSLKEFGFNLSDNYYASQSVEVASFSEQVNVTSTFVNIPNGTYYVEVMGIVYLEVSSNNQVEEPFSFIYPKKQFTVGTVQKEVLPANEEEVNVIPNWIMIPLAIALFLLILICIYKQARTFLANRRYRLAIQSQKKEEEEENDGQINDDDENIKNKKVDKINFLK